MTDTRLTAVDGDVAYADDFSDSILEQGWMNVVAVQSTVGFGGLIVHSSTNWSVFASGSGNILSTSNTGLTWTSRNTDIDTNTNLDFVMIRVCEGDTTRGIAVETSDTAETAYTSNSGATWTTTTSTSLTTEVVDVSFPVAGLIIIACGTATNPIRRSTDQGTTWSNATTQPTAIIYCCHMFDGNNGFAVDVNGDIWRTTNAGVDWTDTTHNYPATTNDAMVMYSVSATTAIFCGGTGSLFYSYDFSTGTITQRGEFSGSPLGLIRMSSGVFVLGTISSPTANSMINLYKTTDSGTSWKTMPFTFGTFGTGVAANYENTKCCIARVSATRIAFLRGQSNQGIHLVDIGD